MSTPSDGTGRPRRLGFRVYLRAALTSFGLGIVCLVLLPLVLVSAVLIAVWVGIPLLALLLTAQRAVCMSYRRMAAELLGGASNGRTGRSAVVPWIDYVVG